MRDSHLLNWAKAVFRYLASLKLAVTLIVVLAAVLAVATFIESAQGRDIARWYVYTTDWFIALLGMLGVNILAATLIRFPWSRRQIGFVITHCGLLVLLSGAIVTFVYGVDAVLALEQGETSDRVTMRDTNRIAVQWQSLPNQPDRPLSAFLFHPGPVDWPEGKQLRVGAINGVAVRVKRYLAHARPSEEWMPSPDDKGVAALRFSLAGPDIEGSHEQWLTASRFGGSTAVGSAKVEFRQAEADTMVEDFLHPPASEGLGEQGLLSIHYHGKIEHVTVSKSLGKKVALADGVSVEFVSYMPNAKMQADGSFVNVGPMPVRPVLELKVYLPGEKEPIRQFARPSFANPDGMRTVSCPVKFWYHHPKIAAESAVELLSTSDGKLYCRVGNGKYEPRGEVHAGDILEAWPNTSLAIVNFVPHARRELIFTPVKKSRGDKDNFEAAAEVELTVGDTTRKLWLQRGDQGGMPIPVKTADGTVTISYGYESLPLGFSLNLKKFTRGLNPGGMGDASYASTIRVQDETRSFDRSRTISMNDPLVYGKYTFYQSGILPSGTGTSLTVAYDPGLLAKYIGSIMTCAGTLIMFLTRSKLANILPFISSRTTIKSKEQIMRKAIAAGVVLACLCGTARAGSGEGAGSKQFDWEAWRSLPVQDAGRQKPLDSLAWETWRLLGNRVSFTDPETHQTLDATAFYIASMLESPTWDKKQDIPSTVGKGTDGKPNPHGSAAFLHGSATLAPGDKWDTAPLLLVDSVEMRKLLAMPPGEKCISPQGLRTAKIQPPGSHSPSTFMLWTQQLVFKAENELSPLEKQGVELFGKLRAYEDHRAGRRLEILPMPDSEKKEWISLEGLVRSPMDDMTDPNGIIRDLQATFHQLRAAYLAGSAAEFNEASHKFLGIIHEIGPKLGAYPATSKINLEVAYNHWAPFRFAWALMLVACVVVLLNMGSRWFGLYPIGLAAYACGMAAMIVGFFMRVTISGRAPVTNMYESVVYVGFGVSVIGLVLELIYRKRFIAVAAAAVSTVALVLADNAPSVLDPSLQPLQPVLRNNFWLVTHVMTITLSYAALALAMGIANITLGYFMVRSDNRPTIEALSRFTYRAIQVGVVLLATGTFLGGMWAAYSWGRFWGWDPKEVWALIALLGYLAVLHARYAGWVQFRGLAALAVSCFSLVIVAWYGVNFVLGAGLHSYGFGGGGKWLMGTLIAVQGLYVGLAMWRSRKSAMPGRPRLRIAPTPALDRADAESGSEAA
jgi:cytochrome c-type biogenesis protein CcsB